MALFGLFNKKDKGAEAPKKGFYFLTIESLKKLTEDTVLVTLNVPQELKKEFSFVPGQYLTFLIEKDGQEERRSYSICSGPGEYLAVAVKAVENGNISVWFNTMAEVGQTIQTSKPTGNFCLKDTDKNVVAIAAGSGITPIMSIAKELQKRNGNLNLFFGNRNKRSIIFSEEIANLSNVHATHFLSNEDLDGYRTGRIDKENFSTCIKENLELLKADSYFLCGPEQMIMDIKETLKFFGVNESKIHYELFTTPVLMKSEEKNVISTFTGVSKVKAILDSEVVEFNLSSKGKSLLDAVSDEGMDAPFSCRGGVCCSCRAKVIKGSAVMTMNYSLTDEEVEKGYILTCQAHPSSEELTISFDE